MQSIARDVYFEDHFAGVTLGAIVLPHGLIEVDAPPAPEDSRSWRATLLNLGGGTERLLVNLDAHPDRTLGARAMECTIAAHEKTALVFRSRPTTFKAQGEETGAEWESIPGVGNIRWAIPEITFSQQMSIHWGEDVVQLEYHPGPSSGASWVVLPGAMVIFVGDAVVRNQPPYLAGANLPAWIETLKSLLSPAYRGYKVVSGRGGVVQVDVIRTQIEFLGHTLSKLEKLAAKHSPPEVVDSLIPNLLSSLKFPSSRLQIYTRRLRYGLSHYYVRHYHSSNSNAEEE